MGYIARADWTTRPPRHITPVSSKAGGVVIHHTATKSPTSHWPACWDSWRGHQRFHMDTRGWSDIAYNWLVCPHGFIFEGRGWDSQNAANRPENNSTLSICWDGGLDDLPNPAVIAAINEVIGEAMKNGWARRLRGHFEIGTTTCPGNLRSDLQAGNIRLPGTTGTRVMGPPKATVSQALAFVVSKNPGYTPPIVEGIVRETFRTSADEGVRADLALGLMCKETGFFRYGGDVQANQWNFGGIGATGGVPGVTFPSIEAGVHAVVRRMRMYAAGTQALHDVAILGRPLGTQHWGKYPHIEDFNGVWATPGVGYGESVVALADAMAATQAPIEPVAPFTPGQIAWLDNRYVRRN